MHPTGSTDFSLETEGTYLKHHNEATYTDKGAVPTWMGLHRFHLRQPLLMGLNIISSVHKNDHTTFKFIEEPGKVLLADRTKQPAGDKRSKRGVTRRQFLKGSAVVGAALGTGGLGYTWFGEPNWLEKVRIRLELPDLPPSLNGMRLVQFSDMPSRYGQKCERSGATGRCD